MGKPPRTTSIGGCALAVAQISQFMKLDEMLETSISHGGLSSIGSAPRPGAVVRVAADHDGVVPGRPSEGAMVTDMVLNVADNGTFRDPSERLDIADGEHGVATIVVLIVELVRNCNRISCGGAPG